MTFIIKFLWTDPGFIKPKYEYVPIEADNRREAISIFNKFLGTPYNYPIIDISVFEYEK